MKDGDKIELQVGDKQPFYGKFNGKDVGLWKFIQEGYTFMNDAGLEINEEQAKIISGQTYIKSADFMPVNIKIKATCLSL